MPSPDILHPALHALPDVTLAVDPRTLRVLDVNRARQAFGYGREQLGTMGLDALIDLPREEIARLVHAADGKPVDVGVRLEGGEVVHASAGASGSAGAAAVPCVLVVIRESFEHARALDEVERIRAVLSGALEGLERITERRRAAAAPESSMDLVETEPPAPRLPELTLAQYVSLCVERELRPARIQEIGERYGLPSEAAGAALDRAWGERLSAEPALAAERASLHAQYKAWFLTQERAREDSAVQAAPQLPREQPAPAAVVSNVRATIAATDVQLAGDVLPFRSTAAPHLGVEQYAALTVELEAYPDRRAQTLALYEVHSEAAWKACEAQWTGRLVADPALRQRWSKLCAEMKRKLVKP